MNRETLPVKLLAAGILIIGGLAGHAYGQWHTLHGDYQRSGHTNDSIPGPYKRVWYRDFHAEMIATRCEAIVADQLLFVGTLRGTVYALDVANGQTVWSFSAAGPVGSSPCYHEGKLYVGSDDRFDRGTLYCLQAATGKLIWQHETPGGIWSSPACDGERVYVGDRSGVLHAVNCTDGTAAWRYSTDYMILKPVSFSVDGQKIVLGSEDLHVYCLNTDGQLLWKSPKLPGLSLRDQGPTIWQGLVIVRTNPADAFHTVLGRQGELLEELQRAIPITAEDRVLLDKWDDLLLAPRPARRKAEVAGVIKYLKEHRHDQTFFAMELKTGSEPWIAPILYTCGLHNPATPPTFHPRTGELYTFARSALTYYVRGVRRYSCLVRLDRNTGLPDWYWPESDAGNWRQFPMIPDETQALSMMGNLIVDTHQGSISLLTPESGKVTSVYSARDTYGGIFGPGALPGGFQASRERAQEGYLTGMPNEWHGPDRSIAAIASGRVFWIAGSQVVCLAGPQVPATATGGTQAPPPRLSRLPPVTPGGNVANQGQRRVDMSLAPIEITPQQLRPYLHMDQLASPARGREVNHRLITRLHARLDQTVKQLVLETGEKPWAPLVVQLGISGEEQHFYRTGMTIQILSLALPHLSPPIRQQAITYLDHLVTQGCPLSKPLHSPRGRRREPFDLGPAMLNFARRTRPATVELADLYALWAYAHYADRWAAVERQAEQITEIFDDFAAAVPHFDPDDMQHDASQRLNRRIAGLLGAVRIFHVLDDHSQRDRAWNQLALSVTERLHHERSDHRLVRPTRGDRGKIHRAKVPRYVDLVPELSRMLHEFSESSVSQHITDLQQSLPLWYQAYGERMIGGENYISPPHLSRGLFLAWADAMHAHPRELASKLDQPWCPADLYYIEKLSAVLRHCE